MNIWQFNDQLAQRLLSWNVINAVAGALLWVVSGSAYRRGIGSQAVGWAIINIGIAVAGQRMTRQRFAKLATPFDPDIVGRETDNLRRILWVNTAIMDPLYVIGGWWLARTRGTDNHRWRGIGHGIMIQGLLLLVFDLIHVLKIPGHRRE